jgi:RNA recognition motif-containing protein
VKNIFVGNLDFNASEEGVRSLFERYGQVNSARIMTDRETGRSRGFAFVEMENEGEADQAITALNGYTLDGRALNVNEARPKPDRGFGGGGAGGGRAFGGGGGGGGRPGGGGRKPGGGAGGGSSRREPRW